MFVGADAQVCLARSSAGPADNQATTWPALQMLVTVTSPPWSLQSGTHTQWIAHWNLQSVMHGLLRVTLPAHLAHTGWWSACQPGGVPVAACDSSHRALCMTLTQICYTDGVSHGRQGPTMAWQQVDQAVPHCQHIVQHQGYRGRTGHTQACDRCSAGLS
jgi:hypothetical protein